MRKQAIWGLVATMAMSVAIGCKSSSGSAGEDFDSKTKHEKIAQSALPPEEQQRRA